jgi:hypothetical protein
MSNAHSFTGKPRYAYNCGYVFMFLATNRPCNIVLLHMPTGDCYRVVPISIQ